MMLVFEAFKNRVAHLGGTKALPEGDPEALLTKVSEPAAVVAQASILLKSLAAIGKNHFNRCWIFLPDISTPLVQEAGILRDERYGWDCWQ